MTLTQLAAFITSKLSDTETASVTACKSYINRRYQMIWDRYLWTETLGVTSKAVVAGDTSLTLSDAPSITFYQSASVPTTFIDFPVAMRFTNSTATDGQEMTGYDWMSFFQVDPNVWNDVTSRRADPTNFINLPKDGSGYCRIKPVPVPQSAGTIYVLGKLKWVELGDSDSPCLRGVDNALLAYAEGDMLERARQYGKAQAKYAEGKALEQVMTDIEKVQQQSISQVVPNEEGYYDPAGGPQ
jgi:hypothetical protein